MTVSDTLRPSYDVVTAMRLVVRILLCLAAWLMLSPLAMAAQRESRSPQLAPCCQADEPCGMPDMGKIPPCVQCPPDLPPFALPPITADSVPPLVATFQRSLWFEIQLPRRGDEFIVTPFRPPSPTLVSLGTQLTC